ncbi:unnamed protein product [Caretta caretta]
MDRGSHFFYALEKKRGTKKHVTCLLAEDGTPLTDPVEMCGRAKIFYASLFSLDPIDPNACRVLWEELPMKGDLHDLQNWYPISLLSMDYKVVAKAISLQLGSVLVDVVHPDQTYTIPGPQHL